jgi:quercetin dioxygenase-like cupin family protein
MTDRVDPIEALLPERAREALLEAAPLVPLAPERDRAVKDRLLARVRGGRGEHTTVRAGTGAWESMGPLMERRILADDGVTRTFLMRLAPGAQRPSHSHAAEESSYVLEGSVRYGALVLEAGDFHVAAAGSVHEGVASDTGALVLIRAAVRPPTAAR